MKTKKLKEIKFKKPDIKGTFNFIKQEVKNYWWLYS